MATSIIALLCFACASVGACIGLIVGAILCVSKRADEFDARSRHDRGQQ